ncbi:9912_t:CDS:2, partial [Funneliformis geosporum]
SLKNVKEYIELKSSKFKENENHVDWLGSDFDIQSEVDSLWTSTTDDNEDIDYEVKEENASKSDGKCVIVDIIDSKLVCCSNKIFRLLRQLIRIWELDFNSVDEIVKVNRLEASNLLDSIPLKNPPILPTHSSECTDSEQQQQ